MERETQVAGMAAAVRHTIVGVVLTLVVMFPGAGAASAQIGQLVSPGPLAKAHATLEGADNCQKCHEPGRKVTPALCLSCHKPVAERIRQKKGVHRDVTDDCTGCHVEHQGVDGELRPFDQAGFDHATETTFPLDGKHAPIAKQCARCHKSRSFLTALPSCNSCHDDVHKGTLGADCRTCHPTTAAFKDAKKQFDHDKSAFPLTGAHRRVDCAKCHAGQKYKGIAFAQCTDCHKSPHKPAIGTTCLSCHTTDTWRTQKVDHGKTAFPLRGAHATVPCARCHIKPPTKAVVKFDRCSTCHTDPHKGSFKQDCSSCHTESSFKGGRFDHTSTRFSLTGRHSKLDCAACHKNVPAAGVGRAGRAIDFRGLQTACVSCHKDVHGGELGSGCEACHSSASFKVAAFKHPRQQEFFGGSHAAVACAGCHVPPAPTAPTRTGAPAAVARYKNQSMACAACHKDPHLGQVGTACERCHTIATPKFVVTSFAHEATAFPLTGKHQGLECRKCHKPETAVFPAGRGTAIRLKGMATTCASCHQDVHLGQLGAACERCHTTGTFKVPAYVHTKQATLMAGKHAAQPCSACHKPVDGTYPAGRGVAIRYTLGPACESCHTDQHQGQMGKTCETCHTPASWRVISRAFHKAGVFPLEGRHLAVDCSSCHLNGALKGTPTRCYDCHWIRRQDDRYRTRLGSDCGSCHRPVSWTAVTWDHGTFTGLPLSPVHRALGCDGCHKNQTFQRGDVTCYSCHAEDYQKAKDPNHITAGFPTACEACHRASHTSWSQTTFNHNSYFALAGTHATQACAACHKNNVYKGTPRDCIGCHRADYDRTTSPNHAAAGFPTACEPCHRASDTRWTGASFNHNTYFALAGVHTTQACAACHKNNVYKGTPRDCIGCHRADYDRTTSPNHVAAGFPTACEPCHRASDTRWTGASFNHNTYFALAGVHATQACAACHKNNVYKGTPRDCVGCHRANYDRTTSPNHVAAGFPTTCEQCHSASAPTWSSSFNHNAVFQLVGRHQTASCASCHVNNVYKGTPRDCVGCHRANYDRTTSPNHVAAGFPTTCEQCHSASAPTWSSSFNHNAIFPLLGRHLTASCTSCHRNNVYKGTPRECYPCHSAQYDATVSPNHRAAGFPTGCEACHKASDTAWNQGKFNHTWFPITSGDHAGRQCVECHQNPSNYKVFQCTTACHTQSEMDSEHRGRAGYRYDSAACYSCHPTGRE